jgi:hypothetical protein
MPNRRITGPKRKGFARPMTQRERDFWDSYEADIVQPVRELQAKKKKKKNIKTLKIRKA